MRGVLKRQLFSLFCAGLLLTSSGAANDDFTSDLAAIDALQNSLLSTLPENEHSLKNPAVQELARKYEQLVQKYSGNTEAHRARGAFLFSMGELSQAKLEYKTLQQLEPADAESAHALAECSLGLGDSSGAVHWLERAVKNQPSSARYHFDLGNAYFLFRHQLAKAADSTETGFLELALEHLRKSTELAPTNPEFAKGYAETFYALENPDWEAALGAWRHYLQVSDDKSLAYSNLTRVHLRLGQLQLARDTLKLLPPGANLRPVLARQIEQAEAAQARKTAPKP